MVFQFNDSSKEEKLLHKKQFFQANHSLKTNFSTNQNSDWMR